MLYHAENMQTCLFFGRLLGARSSIRGKLRGKIFFRGMPRDHVQHQHHAVLRVLRLRLMQFRFY